MHRLAQTSQIAKIIPDYNGFRGASDLNSDMTVKTTEGSLWLLKK